MSGDSHEHGPDCAWHFEQGGEPECLDGFAYQPLRVRPCPYSASPHAHVGDYCEPGYEAGYVEPGRSPSPPVYLCDVPEDCQGHYRRCPHNDKPGRFLLACQPCYAQRLRDGADWCQTDTTDGLPLPVSAYRSEP